jgi:mannose-1-phosphate guanylyltransferase/mannose-6-phosphate isomerase
MPARIQPVILCGGSGTRLWPLSRKSFPKQFVPLINNKSLLQLTLERVAGFDAAPICVTADEHRFLVVESIEQAGLSGSLILEPEGKNTAAAMAIAALQVSQVNPHQLLLFCPADHHIPDVSAFQSAVESAADIAEQGSFITFGIQPTFPSTAYGYIQKGPALNGPAHVVERFLEKPSHEKAQALLLAGNTLWNAGIFLIRADALLTALAANAPDILATCQTAMSSAQLDANASGIQFVRPKAEVFKTCRSESIDYAVLEHHQSVAVVPFAGQWSDVGSWNAVSDLANADQDHNRVTGMGHAFNARNTFVHAPNRPVVALGTQDLIVVDTADAVLIAHRDHVEGVKQVVAALERSGLSEAITHRRIARPWGWYDSIDRGDGFQVKRIGVKPGASLSLQKHFKRSEHWVVVKGSAMVTKGDQTFLLKQNQSTYIEVEEVHRLSNPGPGELEIIEVQSGSYLGEDDIVRLEDVYGRSA